MESEQALIVLVLFMAFWCYVAFRFARQANPRPVRATPPPPPPVEIDVDDPEFAWSASDERQLTRLLRRSARGE